MDASAPAPAGPRGFLRLPCPAPGVRATGGGVRVPGDAGFSQRQRRPAAPRDGTLLASSPCAMPSRPLDVIVSASLRSGVREPRKVSLSRGARGGPPARRVGTGLSAALSERAQRARGARPGRPRPVFSLSFLRLPRAGGDGSRGPGARSWKEPTTFVPRSFPRSGEGASQSHAERVAGWGARLPGARLGAGSGVAWERPDPESRVVLHAGVSPSRVSAHGFPSARQPTTGCCCLPDLTSS